MLKLLIFDLDGVIYRGDKLLPYAKQTINKLSQYYTIYFLTNSSARTRSYYRDKLMRLGINYCSIDNIMTSAYATYLYFLEKNINNKNVFIIGGDGIKKELAKLDINIIERVDYEPSIIDYVIVGLDKKFSYEKLKFAHQAILKGAQFIATNKDKTFPAENNKVIPGSGSIVAAIEAATYKKAKLIGKPNTYALKKILSKENISPQECMIIGDRLETDIYVGKKVGMKTTLVLTGITKKEEVINIDKHKSPDFIIDNLKQLLQILPTLPHKLFRHQM